MDKVKQFKAGEDGYVYCFDGMIGKYRKLCAIDSFSDLPTSDRKQILDVREEIKAILSLPRE